MADQWERFHQSVCRRGYARPDRGRPRTILRFPFTCGTQVAFRHGAVPATVGSVAEPAARASGSNPLRTAHHSVADRGKATSGMPPDRPTRYTCPWLGLDDLPGGRVSGAIGGGYVQWSRSGGTATTPDESRNGSLPADRAQRLRVPRDGFLDMAAGLNAASLCGRSRSAVHPERTRTRTRTRPARSLGPTRRTPQARPTGGCPDPLAPYTGGQPTHRCRAAARWSSRSPGSAFPAATAPRSPRTVARGVGDQGGQGADLDGGDDAQPRVLRVLQDRRDRVDVLGLVAGQVVRPELRATPPRRTAT